MDFEVLICGSDVNAYYMARLTHEAYGKKAYMLIKNRLAYTTHSKIINQIYNEEIWDESKFIDAVNDFAKSIGSRKVLVISSNETYELFLSRNKKRLRKNVFFNYPDEELISTLIDKELFYKTYSDSELDFPKTLYYDVKKGGRLNIKFQYPIIVKPADVVSYNKIDFVGKKKIYKVENVDELNNTLESIKKSDYNGTLIIQEYIPGDDSHLYDSVVYCNKEGKVNLMSLAQIGLQEHNPNMVGNAAVLINGYSTFQIDVEDFKNKIIRFMERIGYVGFAELDLKYDERDGKLKVLEINARQGRCSYYVAMCGHNLVETLVDDVLLNRNKSFNFLDKKVMLTFVNKRIIKKYVTNDDFLTEALKMYRKSANPLKYSKDFSFYRFMLYIKRDQNYKKSYSGYKWE